MRLYHHPLSFNARRAVMAALHLGAKVDLVVVDLAKGAQRAPEYLKMNPNGRVPVLDDDGFFLTESCAIMQYLADKTPGQTVYPQDLRARADVNRWLFWCAHHFAPAISILNWERVVKPMIGAGPIDPAMVERGEAQVKQVAEVLDEHLAAESKRGGGPTWIAQGRLTLADLAIASPLMSIGPAKLPVSGLARLLSWFEQVQELDAWKRTSL